MIKATRKVSGYIFSVAFIIPHPSFLIPHPYKNTVSNSSTAPATMPIR